MTEINKTAIKVSYENRDGYHYFKSSDVRGLFVGNRDFEKAFDEVSRAIEVLMLHNHNIKCKAQPLSSPEEFLAGELIHTLPNRSFCVEAA